MSSETLGFVGLGNIGNPMAERLVAAGHRVIAFDAAGTRERLPSGAIAADSVEGMAAQVGVVFMSLPDGDASKAVCSRLARAEGQRPRIVVDLSTIGMVAAKDCARLLEPAEIT